MVGQRSILSFRFQVRGSVFLRNTKINNDSNVLQCSKGVFSDVLENVALKVFLRFHLPSVSLTVAIGQ